MDATGARVHVLPSTDASARRSDADTRIQPPSHDEVPPPIHDASGRFDESGSKIPTLDDDAGFLAQPVTSPRPPVPQLKPAVRSTAAGDVPVDAPVVTRTSSQLIAPTLGGVMVSPGAQQARAGSHAELGPPPPRPNVPLVPHSDDAKRSLLSAISPGPAAIRRDAAPAGPRDPSGRRAGDGPPRTGVPLPSNVVPPSAFGDDFNTSSSAPAYAPLIVAPGQAHVRSGATPPPTRIGQLHDDRPFQPPMVSPVPEIPEPGVYRSARYTVRFARARWQRRGAIRTLQAEIKQDTDALDQVLGALGKLARQARVEGRVFSAENVGIDKAEERMGVLVREHGDVDGRKAEENSKFIDVERERVSRLADAERLVAEHQSELSNLEAQRRGMRDKRKELERRQKAYLKAAEDNDKQSASSQMGDQRADLRRSAEQHRREAAALEPDRQEVDRRLVAIEKPINDATAKLETAKAELETAKRSLADAREGHGHRLAELDAEQKRKAREISMSEGEVARRLVTLGTLVNLNRIDDPVFAELYQRIDRLRGAITARTTEIEKLTAEREAYDRGTLTRGVAVIGGAIVVLIALIAILRAIL